MGHLEKKHEKGHKGKIVFDDMNMESYNFNYRMIESNRTVCSDSAGAEGT